ncbi:MAG: hypothetical protein IPM42_09610 [Saprospiraceae bacterium]|nr:hypothetical protein [Saprospiraceae bacterium]
MSKMIIGSIVGGFLIFFWQFLSWGPLNLHQSSNQYTPKQDSVMAFLNSQFSEDGFYYMPGVPPETSSEDYQSIMESNTGKPWAQVYYHKSWNANMSTNMFRGYLVNVVSVLLLIWIFVKFEKNDFVTTILSALAVGIISYLTTSYTSSIWFEVPSMPDLIDSIVSWGLCGAWLGWWLNR